MSVVDALRQALVVALSRGGVVFPILGGGAVDQEMTDGDDVVRVGEGEKKRQAYLFAFDLSPGDCGFLWL